MTPDALEAARALVADWQQRLGLYHWTITVEAGDLWALSKVNVYAETSIQMGQPRAVVRILPAVAYESDGRSAEDAEESIVHELLRVVFWGHNAQPPKVKEFVFEQGLNMVARALVSSKRKESATQ